MGNNGLSEPSENCWSSASFMSNQIIERVLNCQSLPSLPGVAMRVIELTQDKNASSVEIAATIQNDPALTSKVLRTINSSFYGLSTPCPSIKRATGLLGLNTVKSIVLGFSLVESTKKAGLDGHFDMLSYWRRGVYSAAGARIISTACNTCDPEEAFVGALLQDIGVLAFSATLKAEYDTAVQKGGMDHDQQLQAERDSLGCDHTQMGALLAERWRLPPQIVECIRWHHEPDKCNPMFDPVVKAVSAGGLAAAALANTDDKRKLGGFISEMRAWFNMEPAAARELLVQINESAGALSKTLELKTGQVADTTKIMAMAHEQLIATQEAIQQESVALRRDNTELSRQSMTDALTGAFNRAYFDRELKMRFERATREKLPLTVLFSDADKFKSINDTYGHQAGDAVLIELAKRLREALTGVGVVCRYGGEEFAIIVPAADVARGGKVAELLRRRVCASPFQVTLEGGKVIKLPVTISLGIATHDAASSAVFASAELLVHTADQGVYAAKQAGRNCVRMGSQDALPPASATIRVLAVEDDPLAARLLGFVFDKQRDFTLTFCVTGEEAISRITSPDAGARPQLVLCDLNLPGISGIDVVKAMRASAISAGIPCVMLSATTDPVTQQSAVAAGANFFIEKSDFCSNFDMWIGRLSELTQKPGLRAAA